METIVSTPMHFSPSLRMFSRALAVPRTFAAPHSFTARARTFSASALRRRVESDVSGERLEELIRTNGDKPMLVDFYAEWCGPCKMLSPILHKLEADPQLAGRDFDLVTIDVDKNNDMAMKFSVRCSRDATDTDPRYADRTCVPQWRAQANGRRSLA